MTDASPWWTPDVHADRRPRLIMRNAITAAMRAWFAARDFVEVETGSLQVSPGNEAHLSAFATEAIGPDGSTPAPLPAHLAGIRLQEAAGGRREAHLQLRPGLPQPRARSRCTSPEFTMLEWYRVGEPYEVLMDDCARLLALAAEQRGHKALLPSAAARPIPSPSRSG